MGALFKKPESLGQDVHFIQRMKWDFCSSWHSPVNGVQQTIVTGTTRDDSRVSKCSLGMTSDGCPFKSCKHIWTLDHYKRTYQLGNCLPSSPIDQSSRNLVVIVPPRKWETHGKRGWRKRNKTKKALYSTSNQRSLWREAAFCFNIWSPPLIHIFPLHHIFFSE